MSRKPSFILLCLLPWAAVQAVADESPLPDADYGVSTIWQLGGTGGWDDLALEPGGTRLFVSRGDRVDVVDTQNGRRTGIVPNTLGVHGIAFAPEFKRGYTSNGTANTVSAFELDSLRVIQEAPVAGKQPGAIVYESRARYVFVADGETKSIDVLDPMTLQVVSSITLPGPPRSMVTDGSGTLFVNIAMEAAKLVAIDARSLKLKAIWSLPECANPTGLAIDVANHRLFSVCAGEIMAITDATSGKQVARVAIGDGPGGAAFDPDLGFVFSSNGVDGTLTVIHEDAPDRYRVIATVQTQRSARTMALDPATHRAFLPAARLANAPADNPGRRSAMVPDSFVILVAEPK